MKFILNPVYTFILTFIAWIVFLYLILPEPFLFENIGAYVVFTMGVFPVLLIVSFIQNARLKFRHFFGGFTLLLCLLAELLLLLYIYSVTW